ncbi:MAG TPA: Uma2 family endonuclease [Chthoniobacteraceae bacterium]|jgi:Uma2 family endonuclease|nr:Uma2 family endonuclease [Chthoniobacteraceae bacterium]
MPAALPEIDEPAPDLAELLRPDLIEEGMLPEMRVVYSGISWDRYLAIDKALGDDRSSPRLYYLNGELEFVTVSQDHDRILRVPDLAELLRPDLLEDGLLPEMRVVYSGISWQRYLAIDQALGEDRSSPRLYYLNGELEIVTVSNDHEYILRVVSFWVDEYFTREGIHVQPRGHTTMRLKEAGAEPDDAWCLSNFEGFPDFVFEVALTSGGVRKLDVYQRLGIPEVWIWRRGQLLFYRLRPDESGYDRCDSSQFVPNLDLALLYRCVAMKDWPAARRSVREGLGT